MHHLNAQVGATSRISGTFVKDCSEVFIMDSQHIFVRLLCFHGITVEGNKKSRLSKGFTAQKQSNTS